MRLRSLIIAIVLLASPINLCAWWHAGHMAVAEIAYMQLSDDAQEWVDALAQTFEEHYPANASFAGISTWPDDIRMESPMTAFDRWHYTNIPYDADGVLTQQDRDLIAAESKNQDVIWAIHTASKTLESPKSSRWEKAFMLAFLVHCVADIHQPLHSTSRYSKEWPNGDLGGNLFKVSGMDVSTLHALWDDGFGSVPRAGLPIKDLDRTRIKEAAVELVTLYPPSTMQEFMRIRDPRMWAAESHQLAVNVAYQLQPGSTPSSEYLEDAKQVCQKRIALAGHRLARLIEVLHAKSEGPRTR